MNAAKAKWNSSRGYSLTDEIVEIIERRDGLVHIHTSPDEGEPAEGFSYWVPASEINEVGA